MLYLIFEILGFLIAAALLGVAVGWLCRGLVSPRQSRTRADHRDQEARRRQIEQLETQLAEAREHARGLEEELNQARSPAKTAASDLRKPEDEHRRKFEGGRDQAVTPVPAHTVSSPSTPGGLDIAAAGVSPEATSASADSDPTEEVGVPPRGVVAPQGEADDLKRISGVGQGIERALNENGIFHYRQIAELTPQNLVWLDRHLRLKGRIEREDWINQARSLGAGARQAEVPPAARQN